MNKITKFAVTGLAVLGLSIGVASTAEAKHTVQSGDTLSKIAYKYGTTVQDIANANPQISNINLIYVGDIINGVGEGYEKPANTSYVSTVQAPQKATAQYVAPKKQYVAPKKQYVPQTHNTGKTYTKEVAPVDNGTEQAAKEWIAYKESRGDYNARSSSSKYIGRYQLDKSYLNGDYSPANQEKTVSIYVKNRYGSFQNAKRFWEKNGWY